MVMMTAMTFTH